MLGLINTESYFSIAFELISIDRPLTYDIYINSSAVESREKYIKVAKIGDVLGPQDVLAYRSKYRQVYVTERQRSDYFKSLPQLPGVKDEAKTTVLKESAIHHLETLFQGNGSVMSTEVLSQNIQGCRDVVDSMVGVLQNYSIDELRDLIGKLSFHDFYTYDHSINVAMYAVLIYRDLFPHATKEDIIQAGMGGLLHDLGKIKIPTTIINNSGKLSDEEFAQIKQHPDYGKTLLANPGVRIPQGIDREVIARAVHEHHENYDGTGYPRKISGSRIHILARITSIADFFDAITTKRSYHEPLSTEDALNLMSRSVGKKLDPKIFQIFALKNGAKAKDLPPAQLAPDFDPCQPHQDLPIQLLSANAIDRTKDSQFGKIRFVDEKRIAQRAAMRSILRRRRA